MSPPRLRLTFAFRGTVRGLMAALALGMAGCQAQAARPDAGLTPSERAWLERERACERSQLECERWGDGDGGRP